MKDELDYIGDLFVDELGGLELTPPGELGSQIIAVSQAGLFPRMMMNVWIKAMFEFVLLLGTSAVLIAYTSNADVNLQIEESQLSSNINETIIINEEATNTKINLKETTIIDNAENELSEPSKAEFNEIKNGSHMLAQTQIANAGLIEHKNETAKLSNNESRKAELEATKKQSAGLSIITGESADETVSNQDQHAGSGTTIASGSHSNETLFLKGQNGGVAGNTYANTSFVDKALMADVQFGINEFAQTGSGGLSFIKPIIPQPGWIVGDDFDANKFYLQTSKTDVEQGFNKLEWSVKAFKGIATPSFTISASDTEMLSIAEAIEQASNHKEAQEVGLSISVQRKHLLLETGIAQSTIKWNESYFLTDLETKVYPYFIPYLDFHSYVDTVDSYYAISGTDTVENFLVNSYQVAYWDSTEQDSVITTVLTNDTVSNNQISFIEIPVIFGYSMHAGRLQLISKVGLIGGIVRKQTGGSFYGSEEADGVTFIKNDFAPIKLDLYVGLEARYPVWKRLFLFGDLFYRRNINDFYSQSQINRRVDQVGVRAGLGFNF